MAQRITRNREDAEDAAQETFKSVFLHLREFERKASFSTWLTRVAVNHSLMTLRRRKSHREANAIDIESLIEYVADSRPGPDTVLWSAQRAEIVRGAVNRLGLPARRAISLRAFEDLSVQETAKTMSSSVNSVKSRISRGQQRLRSMLDDGLSATAQLCQPGSSGGFCQKQVRAATSRAIAPEK